MASKIVLITVLLFDIIAFALAVAAEQRRSTNQFVPLSRALLTFMFKLRAWVVADEEKNYTYCVYNSDIATGYGVGAVLFLMVSQVFVMAASTCFCCGPYLPPGGSRACALLLLFSCWVTFIIAESCLLAGSVENAYHTRYRTLFVDNPPSCQTLRKGVFGAGAAFVFFTTILTELYYVLYNKAHNAKSYS